ncbi:SAM-dependent methyltransferase [Bailinhaonella thermotolerans]|uniref:SAM-dependent methyltransferase n=1 Tax=Bailinhaonella thermotolerans TaxID=1070861 RepID=A0A3A4A5S1_9ACTN|nr:SAM-dependent methyltransferase [Bailinhaonella thermotolerans]RJL23895.1 SAM-dependent methyltransferase [Bailinhaonella thermotolerans]
MDQDAPAGIDPTTPNIARVYDAALGGKDNFAVDRQMVELGRQVAPDAPDTARANRQFLRRVVRELAARGVEQFLDIGSGLPTVGNVHEVAQAVNPHARVVYVDFDPVVLAHGRALLSNDHTTIVTADVRDPDLLGHPGITSLLDLRRPVGLLMFAILHHLDDDEDPGGIVARLRDSLAPGSHLAISHFHLPVETAPELVPEIQEGERLFNATLGTGRWRTRAQITEFFGDFELLDPGVVPVNDWRPEGNEVRLFPPTHHGIAGGVARKH